MAGLRRILVASDLSPRADRALARAAQLAVEHEAGALQVLHVLADRAPPGRQAATGVEEALRRQLEPLVLPPGTAVAIHTAVGSPAGEIPRQAREGRADLIVLGASSRPWPDTTAEQVVHRGGRAVLVVKPPPRGPYQRVLVAVDFSPGSRRALEAALGVAPRAEFHVLHVYEPGRGRRAGGNVTAARSRRQAAARARGRLEAFFGDVDCGRQLLWRVVRYGRASAVIDTVARRLQADLIAVGSVGRAGSPSVALGPVAVRLLQEAACDVLVVRPDCFRFEPLLHTAVGAHGTTFLNQATSCEQR